MKNSNNKKLYPLIIVSLMVIASLTAIANIQPATAYTTYLEAQQTTHSTWQSISQNIYSLTGNTMWGNTFTGAGHYLTDIKVPLEQQSVPPNIVNGHLVCEVYTATGSAGSRLPTTYLGVSAQIDITSDITWANFTDFSSDILLTNGQFYAFKVFSPDSNFLDSEANPSTLGISYCNAAANGTNYGNTFYIQNNALSASSTTLRFYIYSIDTPIPDPTPTPTPTDDYKWDENTNSWTWWNGTHWIPSSGPSPTANAQITTFTGNMITYIVPLCLLLLPAIVGAWALGKAGAAKWGFIAGLNIGAIMCYLYLPDFGLWAVIAIVMVDVIMIFASTRGGD